VDCPCLLTLDLSGLDADALLQAGYDSLCWSVRSETLCEEGAWLLGELPAEQVIEIPRGERASVLLLTGDGGLSDREGGLRIPEGEDCPPLLAFRAEIDASPPELAVPVVLHKRYACLEICLKDWGEEGSRYVLQGAVCGYQEDLSLRPGPFRVALVPDERGYCTIRVPAQSDASLILAVYRHGGLERVFGLGGYILDSGYDWNAPDLEDLSVEIDFYHAFVRIKRDLWSKTIHFSIAV